MDDCEGGRAKLATPDAREEGLPSPAAPAPEILALLEGRDASPLTDAPGLNPKLNLLARPASSDTEGVDAGLALGLFLLDRIVTLDGISLSERGDARGGVFVGAGSRECSLCTLCTLSSSVAIFLRKPCIPCIVFDP